MKPGLIELDNGEENGDEMVWELSEKSKIRRIKSSTSKTTVISKRFNGTSRNHLNNPFYEKVMLFRWMKKNQLQNNTKTQINFP